MPEPLIYKIQKFSIHDGPGIRTTVFFKGCPLRCKWCHNPESQSFHIEDMVDDSGNAERIGHLWAISGLIRELEKDRVFYEETGGGVTLSGGEPMVQDMEYIVSLLCELKRRGISTAIDTCGDAPWENFKAVLPYTDLFLYDIKLWSDKLHKASVGVSNGRILSNLSRLGKSAAQIYLRFPLLAEVNDDLSDMENISLWLDSEGVCPVFISLLPYHAHGRSKYLRLGLDLPQEFTSPDAPRLAALKAFWERKGYRTGIGGSITS